MRKAALVLIGSAVILAAGYAIVTRKSAAMRIGERVNAAHLSYVELADYAPSNWFREHDSVWIYLTAGVTDSEVVDLYCRIITPSAAAQVVEPNIFGMTKGVTWWPPLDVKPDYGTSHGYSGGVRVDPPACP